MLLIGNGNVFTMQEETPFFKNGAVLIEGNKIIEVGDGTSLKDKYPQAEFIDAKGGVIMPAFINAHEHIYSAMARGLSIKGYQAKSFPDILEGMWWTMDRHLTLEQTKQSAYATYLECIKNGVTTVFDHHASYKAVEGSLFAIEEAAKEMGVRSCLCYEVSDRDGEEKAKQAIAENVSYIRHAKEDASEMTAGMFGLHASFTLSDKTLELCAKEKTKDAGYHIHVAEGIEDVTHCLKTYGKRVVDRLHEFSILGEKTIAVHGIYINPHEMDLLKETKTVLVHNPESNMGNACGCPPVLEMMKRGVTVGLGTDGYTHDMLESYKVANILHKHSLCDATAAWGEIPEMLFSSNRKIAAKYFKTPLGVLEKGAAADVIVLDYKPYTPMNETNRNGHILFGMSGRNVTHTIAGGKILMKDRELIQIDEERILAQIKEESIKLWEKLV